MRRREFIALIGGAAVAWPLAARAQRGATPVIGYLSLRSPDAERPLLVPFLQSLEKSGFADGRNIAMEYRFADGREARLPTSTVPIVFATGFDPVFDGLVTSLNRPGGNATGISAFSTELGPKRLTLLKELVPNAGTIAFVVDANNSTTASQVKEMQGVAQDVGQSMLIVQAGTEDQVDLAFRTMADRKISAILFGTSQYFQIIADRLIALAARYRIPAIYEWRDFVSAGGLISYSTDRSEFARLAGGYAARILKGERPADLPVMQSTRFELVLNLRTARAISLDVPTSILLRADEVIE